MPSFMTIGLWVLENIFEGFYHVCAWQPSWSCDQDHFYKFMSPFPKKTLIKTGFDWPSGFGEEDVGLKQVHSPATGADNPLGSNVLQKHKASVNLVIYCKFFTLKDFVTIFPIKTHKRPNLT